jgi:hypothetical protein
MEGWNENRCFTLKSIGNRDGGTSFYAFDVRNFRKDGPPILTAASFSFGDSAMAAE